jgi:hypothetical protein
MKLNSKSIQHWRMKLKKINSIKKRTKKKDSSQPDLTHQTLDLGHETKITLYKVNQNKL